MATIVRRSKSTEIYDSSSIWANDGKDAVDSSTSSSFGIDGYEYYTGVPRRCSRCRMYDLDGIGCKKRKNAETCRKSYSIKKQRYRKPNKGDRGAIL